MTKKVDFPFKSVVITRDPVFVDATAFGGSSMYLVQQTETTVTIEQDPAIPYSDLMANAYADSLRRSHRNMKVEVK